MPVSEPTYDVLFELIGPSTQIVRRVEIYEADGTTLWKSIEDSTGRLISGAVSVSAGNDSRRGLDITLDNRDGSLNSNPYGGLWYDKIIKPYRGLRLNDGRLVEWQLGEFVVDRLSRDDFPRIQKITGRDYVKKLQLAKFTKTTTFTSGRPIEWIIASVASNGGIQKRLLPVTNKVTGKDFTFERGVTRWEAATTVAEAYGYELYFDATGYLVMREYLDPSTSPTAFSFEAGKWGTLVSISPSTADAQLYNHILVTGENSDSTVPNVAAEAMNTEPSSPTNVDRIGDRLYEYASSFITTVTQARDVAAKFLKIHALEQFEMAFDAIVLPWLEIGTIVEIVDPDVNVEENQPYRYLLDTLSIPMGLEPMSGTGKRVTIVTDDGADREFQSNSNNRFSVNVGLMDPVAA